MGLMRTFLIGLLALTLTVPLAEAQRLSGQKTLTTTSYGVTNVTDPVRAGKKAQRFEVRAGDCAGQDCSGDRERAFYTPSKSWRYGTPQFIGFSLFLPKDFKSSVKVETTFAILHQRGGPTNRSEGRLVDPPLVQIIAKGDSLYAAVHLLTGSATDVRDASKILPLGKLGTLRGKWADVMVRLDTSGGRELLEIYLNGSRKVAIEDLPGLGADMAKLPVYMREAAIENFISFHPKEYYFQYGIYRAFVSKHGGPMPTQIAYVDEVRMGRSMETVLVNEKAPVD